MKMNQTWMSFSLAAVFALTAGQVAADQTIERSVDTSSSPTVSIEIDSGELTVATWNESRVKVEGMLDDSVETFEIELKSMESVEVVIEDATDRRGSWGNSDTELTIYLPIKSRVSVEAINASVAVSKLQGDLDIEVVNGPVDVTDIEGFVSIETVNGPVRAMGIEGEIDIESVNGPVDVDQRAGDKIELSIVNGPIDVKSSAKDVRFESVSGAVDLELEKVERFKAETVAGDIRAVMQLVPQGDVSVDGVSSGVRLTFIEPLNISFAVESMTGDIDNDISDVEMEKGKFGLGRSLNFSEGDASAEVRINTVSGNVDLRRD